MTQKEIQQLYYLRREIAADEKRLAALENERGSGPIKAAIRQKKTDAAKLAAQIQQFVNAIDDSLIRQIIQYRSIDMLTWPQIAQRIGGGNSADGLRMLYKRFFARDTNK